MFRTALAALLLLLFGAVLFEAWTLGPIVDEPSHILSSWLWWHGRDRLYPRDMPPLIKIVGGSILANLDLGIASDLGQPGDPRREWTEAGAFFARIPAERLQTVLFLARLPLTIFPLLIVYLLFRWASELFSQTAGLVVAALWAMCPTALGHSGFFKNDIAATATYLLFWYMSWRFWRAPGIVPAVLVGAAAALALLSKLSLLIVIGFVPLILATRAVRLRRFRDALIWPVAGLFALWLVAVAAWQFELHWTSSAELSRLAASPKIPGWFPVAGQLFRVVPVPEGAWTGVTSLLESNTDPVSVYMLGQIYPQGNKAYFLLATILKLAFPTLLLIGAGVWISLRRKPSVADLFWMLPGPIYLTLASLSSLDFGVRLVLPAWVFFFLFAGAAAAWLLRTRMRRILLAGAVTCVAVLSLRAYPYGLAYFNPYAGDGRNSLNYLADSNIDWGQSLGAVGKYVHQHGISELHLSYFGFDKPERYFQNVKIIPVVPPWDARAKIERLHPEPGWYAISATLLPGHLFTANYREYYAEFLYRKPVAVAGGSMFIYRID